MECRLLKEPLEAFHLHLFDGITSGRKQCWLFRWVSGNLYVLEGHQSSVKLADSDLLWRKAALLKLLYGSTESRDQEGTRSITSKPDWRPRRSLQLKSPATLAGILAEHFSAARKSPEMRNDHNLLLIPVKAKQHIKWKSYTLASMKDVDGRNSTKSILFGPVWLNLCEWKMAVEDFIAARQPKLYYWRKVNYRSLGSAIDIDSTRPWEPWSWS